MISIIICSRSKSLLAQVEANVKATIGLPYEIIGIDNSASEYGICEAYNIGAERSKYDILCFMHEDILFHTYNWGQVIVDTLTNKKIGVLGVAGGTEQLALPAGWGNTGWDTVRMNVLHTAKGEIKKLDYNNPKNTDLDYVAAVDGLWMCCRREVWQEIKFDSKAFPGFHFYDIDFCIRVTKKYKNCVTYKVSIEHFSLGTYDERWYNFALSFYKQRKNLLPVIADKLITKQMVDKKTVRQWQLLIHLFRTKPIVSRKDLLYCIIECLKIQPMNKDSLWLLKDFLYTSLKFN